MTHLASSSSSVRWMASVSYLVLHCATSELALESERWSSALASVSSSYCSRSRSQSCRADWRAWASAFLAWGGEEKVGPLAPRHLGLSRGPPTQSAVVFPVPSSGPSPPDLDTSRPTQPALGRPGLTSPGPMPPHRL